MRKLYLILFLGLNLFAIIALSAKSVTSVRPDVKPGSSLKNVNLQRLETGNPIVVNHFQLKRLRSIQIPAGYTTPLKED